VNASATRVFSATDLRAPDLVSVAVVSGQSNAETYDFTFDTTITSATASNFQMVDSDGAVRTGSTADVQTGTATAVVRVAFSAAPNSGKSGIRGVAFASAVTASTTLGGLANNVLESKAVTGRAGTTDFPDLLSVTLDTSGTTTANFVFDEAIETMSGTGAQGSASAFHLVYRTGSVITATSVEKTSSNTATATFSGTNVVNELVGSAHVDQAAVAASGGTTSTKPNRAGQIGIASSFGPGVYLGPRLNSATRSTVTSSGATTGFKVVFVFDQAISSTLTQNATSGFFAVTANGTRTAITSSYCTRSSSDLNNTTVICDSSTATDTTSTAALAIRAAVVVTVGAATVTGTKVRTVGGSAWSASTLNHEEVATV
jgi:hypothetical protein